MLVQRKSRNVLIETNGLQSRVYISFTISLTKLLLSDIDIVASDRVSSVIQIGREGIPFYAICHGSVSARY